MDVIDAHLSFCHGWVEVTGEFSTHGKVEDHKEWLVIDPCSGRRIIRGCCEIEIVVDIEVDLILLPLNRVGMEA